METKKVLITGASGFIGRNLLGEAIEQGWETHALLRRESKSWRTRDIEGKFFRHEADITDRAATEALLKDVAPDYVFHLAAYGSYPFEKDEEKMVRTNILGGINIMNAAVAAGAKATLLAGSSSEYGAKDHPMREDEIIEPDSLYAVTKAAETHYGAMLAKAKNAPIASMRIFSVYGPFEEKTRLIPAIMLGVLGKGKLAFGNPASARDFVYVGDVVRAFIVAADALEKKKIPSGIFNVCSGTQHTAGEMVKAALEISASAALPEWGALPARGYDKTMWVGDGARAAASLGFRPEADIREGLSRTFVWFKEHASYYDAL